MDEKVIGWRWGLGMRMYRLDSMYDVYMYMNNEMLGRCVELKHLMLLLMMMMKNVQVQESGIRMFQNPRRRKAKRF